MKQFFSLLLCICLSTAFSGCRAAETQIPQTLPVAEAAVETTAAIPEETVLPAAEARIETIVEGTGTFYDLGFEQDVTISEFCSVWSANSGITVTTPSFAAVDMDADGEKEVILRVLINGVSEYGVVILHQDSGTVYGFLFSERQLGHIKSDGSFWYSGGEGSGGSAKITFCKDRCTYTDIPADQYDSQTELVWYDYPASSYSHILN